jgi:hypothetical protein
VTSRVPAGVAIVLAVPLVAGVVQAVRHAWVCDDIFITFRYVEHLTRGHGLVFNIGERVAGYTHFLWAILLAAVHRLGFDLETLGRYLPVVPWAATLAVLFGRALGVGLATAPPPAPTGRPRLAWLHRGRDLWLALPVAAWSVALHEDLQGYASGGLETSLFGFLLLVGLLLVTAARPRLELAAIAYALATLVRPEGVLYTLTAAAFLAWQRRGVRDLVRPLAVWAALVLPFAVWQVVYYGSLLPNTFHAKSGASAYWSQGWIYTWMYVRIYWIVGVCFLVAVAAAAARRSGLIVLAATQVAVTVLYVARLGGDFMFARFYLPVTPLVYLAAEEAARGSGRRLMMVFFALLAVGGTLAAHGPRAHTFAGGARPAGIADERAVYDPEYMQSLRRKAGALARLFGDVPVRVLVTGGQAMLAYWARLPYAVEGAGLTNAEIAHQPLAARTRPGHEKEPSAEFLRRNRIQFRLLYGPHRAVGLEDYEKLFYEDMIVQINFYDRAVMNALATRPGVAFTKFPELIDSYLTAALAGRSRDVLLGDWTRLQQFYFRHNDDPERLARVRTALLAAGVPAADLDDAARRD